MKLLIVLMALFPLTSAWGAPDLQVYAMKMPVWLERDAQRQPLALGMELHNGDTLVTGQNARVLLKAADGSDIKLGESARLKFSGLGQHREKQVLFSAALDVMKGAFRFTTAAVAKLRGREVDVKVGGATIGIRGTDVWGMTEESASDVVCLIEGKISVAYRDQPPFVMAEPLSLFTMPKSVSPATVTAVDMERLKMMAAKTEIAAGQGAVSIDGQWKVNLKTIAGKAAALAAYNEMRLAGYDVRILSLTEGQYRLNILQLPNRVEAESLARELTGKMGIDAPVVSP